MVTLVKRDASDMYRELVISDGTFIDYITAKLDNMDIFRVLGKALSLGYSDFVVEAYMYGNPVKVLEMRNGDITVNWDVVRIVDKNEWYARTA